MAVTILCVRNLDASSDVEAKEASVVPVAEVVAETVAEEVLLTCEAVDAPAEAVEVVALLPTVTSADVNARGERVDDTSARVGVAEGDADGVNDVAVVQSTELVVSSTVLDVVELSVVVVRLVVVLAVVEVVVMVAAW